MKIKRFMAKNMREAIRQVREEQGPDAVILSNRRVNGGIEVVAAVDYDEALMQQSLRRASLQMAARAKVAESGIETIADATVAVVAEKIVEKAPEKAPEKPAEKVIEKAPVVPIVAATVGAPLIPRPSEAMQILLDEYGYEKEVPIVQKSAAAMAAGASAAFAQAAAAPVAVQTAGVMPAKAPSEEFLQLKKELGGMRRMIEQQLAGLAWNDLKSNQPQRYAVLRVLSDLGLEPELARSIAEELPSAVTPERARFLPLGLLSRRIPIAKRDVVLDGGVVALVGPTGVGKTTTIAKLAARYAERHGLRDIALVAMDHYRVGAQEQLYTYGRLLGVPVYTVTPKQSLADTLAKLTDRKLVLIDTVGLGPRDGALGAQIQMLREAHPKLRAYLTMAAHCQAADQSEVVRRFGPADLAGCILSKVDETSRIGGALSVIIRHGLPLAYVADGQRVPEDLHVARADELVIRAMRLARQLPAKIDDEVLEMQYVDAVQDGAYLHV
ncbi:MAG: flagellar biosynthesis protein FlhF [Nevskia sp.]|jgi:flagellar biosynthesis protein FlhF|nr:flagellar biosynthesis protein FlhF [Nevskia sp.]